MLHPDLRQRRNRPQNQLRQPQARLEEARGLAAAIGLEIVDSAIVGLSRARPATLFGRGKVDEIASLVGA
ncbi:MAG: GTPase HflX, partial [Alphaproteobacteria bacterium]|nr:GTPase HflX [Alphaproteobacteria bacterium]